MPNLELFFLGPPRIILAGTPLNSLGRVSATVLLAYLATQRKPVARYQLLPLFWPDKTEKAAQANLRRTLYDLKKAIGPGYIQTTRQQVELPISPHLYIDVVDWQQTVEDYSEEPDNPGISRADCLDQLAKTAVLYQDDFLAGLDLSPSPPLEEWQLAQARTFHKQWLDMLQCLTHGYEKEEDFETALTYAHQWATAAPLDEAAYRQLMRLYAFGGQRNKALEQYAYCATRLQQELGLAPATETEQLYNAIKAEELKYHRSTTKPAVSPTKMVSTNSMVLPLTPFLGRQAELAQVKELLLSDRCRLITLIGPGGSGKTRLALHIAEQFAPLFDEGTAVIFLSDVTQPDHIIPTILDGLDLEVNGRISPQEQLITYLRHKKTLLILDNFEHLITAVDTIDYLLQKTNIKLLITSRCRLNLNNEWLIEINGLTYPTPPHPAIPLHECSAIQLFIQTAQRLNPNFQLTSANQPHIIKICQLVEGSPLAIELAAAWIRTLTPTQIAQEISQNLDFLAARSRNTPPRHHSLRVVFEHSWQNLSPTQQEALVQLAHFPANFSRAAAQHVAQATLPLLASLVDQSFLRLNKNGFFRIHELLRQFAAAKTDPNQTTAIQKRISSYYAHLIQQQEPRLNSPQVQEALQTIVQQFEAIRQGWLWAVAHQELHLLQAYIDGLAQFLKVRSRFIEGEQLLANAATHLMAHTKQTTSLLAHIWMHQAEMSLYIGRYEQAEQLLWSSLAHFNETKQWEKIGRVYRLLGILFQWRGQNQIARDYFEKSLDIFTEIKDTNGMAGLHNQIGVWHHAMSDYEKAATHLHTSLKLYKQIDHPIGIAGTLNNLGHLTNSKGNYHEARHFFQKSLLIDKELGNRRGMAIGLNNLGIIASNLGQYEAAQAYYEESLALRKVINDRQGEAMLLANLGDIACRQEAYDQASTLLTESWRIYQELENRQGIADVLIDLGNVAYAQKSWTKAREFLQQAVQIHQELSNQWGKAVALGELGHVALQMKEYDLAHSFLQQALKVACTSKIMPVLADLLLYLGKLYNCTNQLQKALLIFVSLRYHENETNPTRDLAKKFEDEVAQQLSPELVAQIQQTGVYTSLEKVAHSLLDSK